MEEGGPSRKKWKPAGVETTDDGDEAPLPAETEAPDPAGVGEDDDDGLVDRISSLPDAVLGDIISLLPTDEGARTQILASKWRHLWLSAPLNLDCTHLWGRYGGKRAAGIVSRILSSHPGPGRRIRMDGYHGDFDVATVDAWLRSGALDGLQDLELGIGYYSTEVPLPSQTFRFAPTLRVATIIGYNLPDSTIQGLHFPLLKQLGLDRVSISECSLHSLIAGCPALECLLIRNSIGFRCLRINSLTLRSIGVYDNHLLSELSELIIENAPCLEKLLNLHFGSGLHVSVVSAPQLETIGHLSDGNYWGQDNVDSKLVYGSTIIQGLHVDKLAMVIRTVKTLAVQMNTLSLDTVIQLMPCFPCLDKLYIQTKENKSKTNNLWRRKHRDLTRCLDIRLKTIVLDSYRGIKSEVDFVTFFVLNARLLELVKLVCCSRDKEFLAEQLRKLQLDKRASNVARIHFTTHQCVRCFLDHVRDMDLVDPFLL